jgi:hypothetical protein
MNQEFNGISFIADIDEMVDELNNLMVTPITTEIINYTIISICYI